MHNTAVFQLARSTITTLEQYISIHTRPVLRRTTLVLASTYAYANYAQSIYELVLSRVVSTADSRNTRILEWSNSKLITSTSLYYLRVVRVLLFIYSLVMPVLLVLESCMYVYNIRAHTSYDSYVTEYNIILSIILRDRSSLV